MPVKILISNDSAKENVVLPHLIFGHDPMHARWPLHNLSSVSAHREKGYRDGDSDQHDDDPFKHFHAAGGRTVRHLAIDAFQRLQLAQNARIPGFQVETL